MVVASNLPIQIHASVCILNINEMAFCVSSVYFLTHTTYIIHIIEEYLLS